ncbi:MAG TPA: hypothetical protein VFQ79_24570 [Bryobacteraceae bacterium]|nr:hypothetical protein [Bryobacteraceae bacterium]
MIHYYTLIGQTPVPCDDLLEWARWFEENDRTVMRTRILGLCEVSTVFLGLDHGLPFRLDGPPVLFETAVFWLGEDQWEMARCSTWSEAEEQHRRLCMEVARPRRVLVFIRRTFRDAIKAAKDDWRSAWRELRGIEPSEIEVLVQRLRNQVHRYGGMW